MSTNTGLAPTEITALAVATKVNDGMRTSSPYFISRASKAACNAAVPEFTATAYFDLTNLEANFSNS